MYLLSAPQAEQKAFAWHSLQSSDDTSVLVNLVHASASSGFTGRNDTPGSNSGTCGLNLSEQNSPMFATACHSQGRSQLKSVFSLTAHSSRWVFNPCASKNACSTANNEPPGAAFSKESQTVQSTSGDDEMSHIAATIL